MHFPNTLLVFWMNTDCSNIENDSIGESDESQDDYCTGESDAISSFPLLSPYTTPEQVKIV